MKPLDKQKVRLFALAWLKGLRGRELLFSVGLPTYNVTAVIKKWAKHPDVIAEIQKIEAEKESLKDINIATLMVHLSRICYFNGQEMWELAQDPSQEWSLEAQAAIASVKVTKSYRNGIEKDECLMDVTTEIKAKDTLRAAKMLGDHLGAFKDLPTLLTGLKSYGVEVERVDGKYQVVADDSDEIAA
jgi:hypothetical protein